MSLAHTVFETLLGQKAYRGQLTISYNIIDMKLIGELPLIKKWMKVLAAVCKSLWERLNLQLVAHEIYTNCIATA